MNSLKSRPVSNLDLPALKQQAYVLRDQIFSLSRSNPELHEALQKELKGAGVTNLLAKVFFDRASWAELKVHSSKEQLEPVNAYATVRGEMQVFSERLAGALKEIYKQDTGLMCGFVVGQMPEFETRHAKTADMKKLMSKTFGSPLKMMRPFRVTISGTKCMAVNIHDTPDGKVQKLWVVVPKEGKQLVSLSKLEGVAQQKFSFEKLDDLPDTIQCALAAFLYESGLSIRICGGNASSLDIVSEVVNQADGHYANFNDRIRAMSCWSDVNSFAYQLAEDVTIKEILNMNAERLRYVGRMLLKLKELQVNSLTLPNDLLKDLVSNKNPSINVCSLPDDGEKKYSISVKQAVSLLRLTETECRILNINKDVHSVNTSFKLNTELARDFIEKWLKILNDYGENSNAFYE